MCLLDQFRKRIFSSLDTFRLPSPCYLIEENFLEENLKILKNINKKSGAKILFSLKAFSLFYYAPLFKKYISGISASGLYEAKLGKNQFKMDVHTCGPAYKSDDINEISKFSNYIIFNSFNQLNNYNNKKKIQTGIRINPQCSVGNVEKYNPSARFSRFGVTLSEFKKNYHKNMISGLHFHNLCEQNVQALNKTIKTIERDYSPYLKEMEWVNFGGGHLITRDDYDRESLISICKNFSKKYDLEVFLEPGEAVVYSCGIFITEVLDIIYNEKPIVIVDSSPSAHIPDVIETPYMPEIIFASEANKKKWNCRIGGITCFSGDIYGDYSFDIPLNVGDRVMIYDTTYYSFVKSSYFNGVPKPSVFSWNYKTNKINKIKEFNYSDYKSNLG